MAWSIFFLFFFSPPLFGGAGLIQVVEERISPSGFGVRSLFSLLT